jgi:hypothetical protein
MNFDDFLRRANISRYRRLLSASTNKAERQTILKLLGEEVAKSNERSGIGGGNQTEITRTCRP